MEFAVRPYHPSDQYALHRICHLTGPGAADPTSDPELHGLYYSAPYVTYEPDLCFVLTGDEQPCGYCLGTRDSAAHWTRLEREWFPALRRRFPLRPPEDESADARLIRRIHTVRKAVPVLSAYPAHLHIDLLPSAQGKKLGHLLMNAFLDRLTVLGVAGVHLGTGMDNPRAVAFYDRAGFTRFEEKDMSVIFVMRLPRTAGA